MYKRQDVNREKCLYVDDLALFYSSSSTAIIKYKLQRAVCKMTKNSENIGFTFSIAKTAFISVEISKVTNLTQQELRISIIEQGARSFVVQGLYSHRYCRRQQVIIKPRGTLLCAQTR